MKASPKRFLQFSLLASQKPVCASKTKDPFFIDRSFHVVNSVCKLLEREVQEGGQPSCRVRVPCLGAGNPATPPLFSLPDTFGVGQASGPTPPQGNHKGPHSTSSSTPALTMTPSRWRGRAV